MRQERSAEKKKKQSKLIRVFIVLATIFTVAIIGFFGIKEIKEDAPGPLVGEQEETKEKVVEKKDINKISKDIMQIPILMYHIVSDEAEPPYEGLSLRVGEFREQMAYLKEQGYNPVTMKELSAFYRGEGNLPKKPIALTFDDGSRSVYANAFPIMKEYGFISTQYIIGDAINGGSFMTLEQIMEMKDNGHEIGSHTMNHKELVGLSVEEATMELISSKERLNGLFGISTESFCYPVGKYSKEVAELVKGAGYSSAVTTEDGYSNLNQGLWTLTRIRIQRGDGGSALQSKLQGYEEFLKGAEDGV